MANSNYWGEPKGEPMNISEVITTPDKEDRIGDSEMEEGPDNLEVSSDIVMTLQEPIDVDGHMPVTESWAESMDDIDKYPSEAQEHTHDNTDSEYANQEDTGYEKHNQGQYLRESRDTRRSDGGRIYDQPRVYDRQNFRGRGFEGGFRYRNFRDADLRRRGCRGRGRGYRNPPRFMPRGPPIPHTRYGTNPGWVRRQVNWDQNAQFCGPEAQ